MTAVYIPNSVVTRPKGELTPNPAMPIIPAVEIDPVSAVDLSTPTALTSAALDPTTPPFALNHARILYDNLLVGSSTTSTGGSNSAYTLIPNTFQGWTFTLASTQAIVFILPVNQSIDTVFIGAHNLGGTTVSCWYDDDESGTFTSFAASKSPTTDSAIMFHVGTSVSARIIRILISGATGLDYKIGFVSAGIAMQMPRPFFSGHNPMSDNKQHRYYDAWTETGQMVGRSKRSVQLTGEFSWDNVPDAWYRTYMPAFKESATRFPYGIAWNLLEYPDDVAMAFTDEDISAPYSGTRNLRSISFSARGIG